MPKLKIVFDMDNTLVDELGQELRPGITNLLEVLAAEGHELVLWTSSTRRRARIILAEHGLERHFRTFLFREDYDPDNRGLPKDIRDIDAHVLIDDDPKQVRFLEELGAKGRGKGRVSGILITCYRGGDDPRPGELAEIANKIHRLARPGLLGWLME